MSDICCLGDCIKTLKGYAFKSSWYKEEGLSLVKVSDFTVDSIGESNTKIPRDIAVNYNRFFLAQNDVLIQTVGSWPSNPLSVVGKVVRVPFRHNGSLLNQNAVKILPKKQLNNGYLFYLLKSPDFYKYITGCATGAASQASITLEDINSFKFKLIAPFSQKRIASVFLNYDNLIENNNRRIAILEEMAQKLYREWFVHFRFPGHENIKMVESEMGLIPEGWEIKRFDGIASFIKGRKAVEINNQRADGYVKNILLDAVSTGNYNFVDSYKMVLVTTQDIMMVMDGASSGKVFSGEDGAVGSTLAKIETEMKYQSLILLFLSNHEIDIMDNNTGSAIPHANKAYINMMRICVPDSVLLEEFDSIVKRWLQEKLVLKNKNVNLRKTRDLLLPRLISGDIDVSDLDIPVKEG